MDFNPTETQTLLAHAVSVLLEREYAPPARRQALASGGIDLWARLAELGVLGVEIDEQFGGSGGTFGDLAAALAPFGRALVVAPFLSTVVLGAHLVSVHGSPSQKAAVLPGVAAGRTRLALAHGECATRDAVQWVTTRARRVAAGWRLDGVKSVVLGGDSADLLLVSARTGGSDDDEDGVSLFLVPPDRPGVSRRGYTLYDGSGAADLALASVTVPDEALLGAAGAALPPIGAAFDRGCAAVCAEAIGVMERLHDLTADYLRTRVQFGQPIGKFQVLQHRMVDLHIEVELARSMALLAIAVADEPPSARRARAISAAKARISQAARTVAQSAVQLHGAIALTDDYAVGHYFKKLTLIERLFGNAAFHIERFGLLKDG